MSSSGGEEDVAEVGGWAVLAVVGVQKGKRLRP